ncbi:MAG: hypothetical protein BMS9Abin31_0799 [Gammaproteobacteria bacterium]|nr:MAG: hypothetical protein BMS9Abin31_0799 [Gammaproteobacteria bacterium]
MKTLLPIITFLILTACSQQAVYDMIHERERQECLKKGHADCPRTGDYDKYKRQRDEVIQYDNTGNIK